MIAHHNPIDHSLNKKKFQIFGDLAWFVPRPPIIKQYLSELIVFEPIVDFELLAIPSDIEFPETSLGASKLS